MPCNDHHFLSRLSPPARGEVRGVSMSGYPNACFPQGTFQLFWRSIFSPFFCVTVFMFHFSRPLTHSLQVSSRHSSPVMCRRPFGADISTRDYCHRNWVFPVLPALFQHLFFSLEKNPKQPRVQEPIQTGLYQQDKT